MNDALVQNIDFLDEQAMHVQSDYMNKTQSHARAVKHSTEGKCIHVNLSIHKLIQTGFISGMPHHHIKMLVQERTNSLVQSEEQEKSVKQVNNENNDHNLNYANITEQSTPIQR